MMPQLLIVLLASLVSGGIQTENLEQQMGRQRANLIENVTTGKPTQRSENILKMSTDNMLKLLTSSDKFYNNDTDEIPGSTFFETFYNFMLTFEKTTRSKDVVNDIKLLNKTLTLLAQHNLKEATNNLLGPIQIWLSVMSSVNIARTLEQVIELAEEINYIYRHQLIVSTITIDYGFLTLDSRSIRVVQEDINMCNAKFYLTCAFVFRVKNCGQPRLYVERLLFTKMNWIIYSSENRGGDRSLLDHAWIVKSCKNANIITPNTYMLFNTVRVDLRTQTYAYISEELRNLTNGAVIVSVNFLNDDNLVSTLGDGKQLWNKETWMINPSRFDMNHSWVWLRSNHLINNQLITTIATKFRTVVLEVDGTNKFSKLQQIFQFLSVGNVKSNIDSSYRTSWNEKYLWKVKIYLEIDNFDYEKNKALIDEILRAIEWSDAKFPGMVDTILIDRNSCLDENFPFDELLEEESDEIYAVDFYTWMHIKSRISHLQLKHPPKLGAVVDYTNFDSYDNMFNGNSSTYGSLKYGKIPPTEGKIDIIIYKLAICLDNLKRSDAQFAFYNLSLQIENLYLTETTYNVTQNAVYYFQVSGCSANSSDMEESTEYLYFYDIINKWAVNENKFVILGNAFEMVGPDQNSNVCQCVENNITCSVKKCGCGLWTVKQNQEELLIADKKSALTNFYLKKIADHKKASRNINVDKSWTQLHLLLILFPVFMVCVILSAVFPWLAYRHRRRRRIFTSRQLRNFFYGSKLTANNGRRDTTTSSIGQEIADSQPYNKERFEISRSSFKFDQDQPLGSGEFGYVFSGSVVRAGNMETFVAVKTVKKFCKEQRHGGILAFRGLLSEIKILCYIGDHENVIKIIGANTQNAKKGEVYILLELCPTGSLLTHLRSFDATNTKGTENFIAEMSESENNTSLLPNYLMSDLFRWSREIARGMEYLTGKDVVHMDLAARNVLLDATKCAKISDFGLSRRLYGYSYYIKNGTEPLPWRWMPPESLQRSLFTEKSDVWSYGVTLWEIYTLGDIPYPEMTWNVNFPLLLNGGYRPSQPKYSEREMYDLMKRCWETSSENRPTFSEILSTLHGEALSENIQGRSSSTLDVDDLADTSV